MITLDLVYNERINIYIHAILFYKHHGEANEVQAEHVKMNAKVILFF